MADYEKPTEVLLLNGDTIVLYSSGRSGRLKGPYSYGYSGTGSENLAQWLKDKGFARTDTQNMHAPMILIHPFNRGEENSEFTKLKQSVPDAVKKCDPEEIQTRKRQAEEIQTRKRQVEVVKRVQEARINCMGPLSPKQIARTESICHYFSEFLRLRAQEIVRAKPEYEVKIKGFIERKILWVHRSLTERLPLGTEMYLAADILISEDERKKRPLLEERDEHSLFFKIVVIDDADQAPDECQHTCDLQLAFSLLDPQLGHSKQMMINWAWWDFIDSIDMYVFNQAVQRFESLKNAALNDTIIQMYRAAMKLVPTAPQIQRADILNYELGICQRLLDRWAERHEKEKPYCALLVHLPPQKDMNVEDTLILDIAKHLTAIEKIKAQQGLDASMRKFYAELVQIPAQDLTASEIIKYESKLAATLKSKLRTIFASNVSVDEPVNHKARIFEGMKQRLEKMRADLTKPGAMSASTATQIITTVSSVAKEPSIMSTPTAIQKTTTAPPTAKRPCMVLFLFNSDAPPPDAHASYGALSESKLLTHLFARWNQDTGQDILKTELKACHGDLFERHPFGDSACTLKKLGKMMQSNNLDGSRLRAEFDSALREGTTVGFIPWAIGLYPVPDNVVQSIHQALKLELPEFYLGVIALPASCQFESTASSLSLPQTLRIKQGQLIGDWQGKKA
ncbi:MAG: hypothetical protein NTX50_31385 [Candidatus Sumerlaeota bacterium]|nr:hypothetical protein [Candidatus Sumerlaeota bacterium]